MNNLALFTHPHVETNLYVVMFCSSNTKGDILMLLYRKKSKYDRAYNLGQKNLIVHFLIKIVINI